MAPEVVQRGYKADAAVVAAFAVARKKCFDNSFRVVRCRVERNYIGNGRLAAVAAAVVGTDKNRQVASTSNLISFSDLSSFFLNL